MSTKNVHIYNALARDRITIDGAVVKRSGLSVPDIAISLRGLRISFFKDFEMAKALGHTDALDVLVLDANEVRGAGDCGPYHIYGRGKAVRLEIS